MIFNKQTVCWYRCWPWWRWLLTGLAALALALSFYLSWHSITGAWMIGCSGGSSCDKVLSSPWSTIAGLLPVSSLAAGAYLAMLTAVFFIGPTVERSIRYMAWGTLLVISGAAAGSAVWFTILQKWVIGAFCPYCMTMHIIGLLLAGLVFWRASIEFSGCGAIADTAAAKDVPAWRASQNTSAFSDCMVKRLYPVGLSAAGLLTAGILAVCQMVFTPPARYLGGQSEENQPAVDPHTVPLIGSPDALYVVVLLYDYACSHCQQLHFMLEQAASRSGGKLAFALCPTPLNSRCNPYVAKDAEEFKDSCELAKIALTVWLADRRKFADFEKWMFSFESGDRWKPRRIDAAKAKAVELVGQDKYDAAAADPWIEEYLQTSIRIYSRTIQDGKGAVPKLIYGSRWVIPQPSNAQELAAILQNSLAVPAPDS